jgi:hypothetical protein
MMPPQAFGQEDLVDPAPLDRDPLLFVEIVPESVQGPAGEGQSQALGIGQGGGDDLGPMVGRVGRRPARAGLVLEAGEALFVEAMDPEIDGGPADVEFVGDGGGAPSLGGGQEDPGALDEPGGRGARMSELFEVVPLLGCQLPERESVVGRHGRISFRKDTLSTSQPWRQFSWRMHHLVRSLRWGRYTTSGDRVRQVP